MSTLITVLTNYMTELSSGKITNTAVNAVTALQTKSSFKQSKSDTAGNAIFCNVYSNFEQTKKLVSRCCDSQGYCGTQ